MVMPKGFLAISDPMSTVLMVQPVRASGPFSSSPWASLAATRSIQSKVLTSMFISDRPALSE